MSQRSITINPRIQLGVGLIEILVSIVIAMLLVLVIYQIYEISEAQKRTITAGNDAQQNASYGLYVLSRDIAVAGNGIASVGGTLDQCALLRPIPVLITAGATANDPDRITVLYGGSSSLATAVPLRNAPTGAEPYLVPAPVGFSPGDVIAAVQGANCTLSTIDAGGVAIDATGNATLTHTPIAGAMGVTYAGANASVINLGQATSMGRIDYTVDTQTSALRTQKLLPNNDPVTPVVGDVVNLKAQYGLDVDNDGIVEAWQPATGGTWSVASLPGQPPATWQQIRAIRVAIVSRSAQYEKDLVSPDTLILFGGDLSMAIGADERHYRYKVLETVVPLRNHIWNFGPTFP